MGAKDLHLPTQTSLPAGCRILVSACLLGHKVRYDGGDQHLRHERLSQWAAEDRLIPCCPEVLGGLATPRPPAEIQGAGGSAVLRGEAAVRTAAGEEVTAAFVRGAAAALELARAKAARVALLCQRSPSCGSRQIYNGRFEGRLVPGRGVTAALLAAHGIAVFGPEEIDALSASMASS